MMLNIRDAVIRVIKENFPDHKIYDEEVKQGLKKPCFFVDLIPIDIVKINPNKQDVSMIVDIQYMSKEDTKTKNLEIADSLGQLFTHVEFNGMKVSVTNERFEIIDRILHYLFDLDFILIGTNDENIPFIGEVHLNEEV